MVVVVVVVVASVRLCSRSTLYSPYLSMNLFVN